MNATSISGPAPVRVWWLRTNDFDELAAAFTEWDNRFEQLDAGPFDGLAGFVTAGGVQYFEVATGRGISARGTHPAGSFVFSPVQPSNDRAVWRGRALRSGTVNILGPDQAMNHRTCPGYHSVDLTVSAAVLDEAAVLCDANIEDVLRGAHVVADPNRCADLDRDIRNTLRALSERAGPALGAVHERVTETLILLLRTLTPGRDPVPPNLGAIRREQLVRKAIEYMLARLNEPVTTFDLCRELEASERALQYAFREVTRLSPMAYLKARRLNAVRRALKAADPRAETVWEVAARWGFTHSGEFAADYQRLFGELPSRTLQKR